MFKIDGKQNIYISRGDTATCDVEITNPEFPYADYDLQDGDYLIFTVRSAPKELDEANPALIQKTLSGKNLTFTSQDTSSLNFGQYFYDIKLVFADGSVNTIIPSVTGNHYNVIADLPSFNVCEVVH